MFHNKGKRITYDFEHFPFVSRVAKSELLILKVAFI